MKGKFLNIVVVLLGLFLAPASFGWVKGIYVSQPTLESAGKLRYLIDESKAVGINTFVVDVGRKSQYFDRNIKLVTENGINFVARIVVFPGGGSVEQVEDPNFWQPRLKLINYALDHGAKTIQLDYIRFNTSVRSSPHNAKKIQAIIEWFRDKVHQRGAKLQVAVFGETTYYPSTRIGQDIKVFAPSVDSVSPMLYPSHWASYSSTSQHPYNTVYNSLKSLDNQFENKTPFSVVAYIETSNYRYHIAGKERLDYIHAQLRAVEDADAQGWYAWSANNYYNSLFRVLHNTDELR